MERIQWKRNTMAPSSDKFLSVMDVREIKKAKAFHESFPQYTVTPLVSLKNLASYIGVDSLFVKDESYRFGLNAFKVLGVLMRWVNMWLNNLVKQLKMYHMMY